VDVLMISPGYPAEIPLFTQALAVEGARVIGVGDQPADALPEAARRSLSGYVQISSFADEEAAVEETIAALRGSNIDRVESMWEATMYLAARLRERIGTPGLDVAHTAPFRDKQVMKEVLGSAGIRVPQSVRASTVAGVRAGAEEVGYPLIIKPIAGAGSMDTYRLDSPDELEPVLPALRGVPEVSVEEFIDGEEYTFDTISAGGRIAYYNVCWYRPRPLAMKQLEWVSPQVFALRDPDAGPLAGGVAMGHAVHDAMGIGSGFAHMEWYLTTSGEVVFGEIGARVGGARLADIMNWASDIDVYRGWAETVVDDRFTQYVDRKYNAALIFKRAQGQGRIQHIEGLSRLLGEIGDSIVHLDLLPLGAPRRDWTATTISDGFVALRHPDLETTIAMADRVATELQLYAG
jgi:biotin carboxylase